LGNQLKIKGKKMLEKLEKEELLDLIYEYNNYVMDFDQENGWPVCVKEFFSIEYQMILEERMGDTSSQGEYASEFATEVEATKGYE
jgi:hypothetical protein